MEKETSSTQKASLSDYLAAERTLLAWIRTGLAMMGFGFVVARFGLFLQEIHAAQNPSTVQTYGLSLWFGTALIAVGVIVTALAGWRHVRLVRQIDRGESSRPHATQAVTVAFLLAAIGLAMAIYRVSIRKSAPSHSDRVKETSMALSPDNGIVEIPCHHSIDETVSKLKSFLEAKGATLFALVDHSGEAAKVGLSMPPTKLLIFGSPKAGTPLMLAAPSIAIDLPLKILIREDPAGKAWLSYSSSQYLMHRHNIPDGLLKNIAVIDALATHAAS